MTIALPPEPLAPRKPHTWTRITGDVDDHYAWLRHKDDPDTLDYLTAENAYAEAWFSRYDDLSETIFQEIKSRVVEDDSSVPVEHRGHWYVSRTMEGLPYAIHSRGPNASSAMQQQLLDENHEAKDHEYFAINAFEVSNDSRLLAWSYDVDGSEYYTLRIRDIDESSNSCGVDLVDEITRTTWGGTAWSADDTYLFYVTPDEQMRPWQVWRHRIGTEQSDDVKVFEETDERFFVGIEATRSGDWIIIDSSGKQSSEVWLLDARRPVDPPLCVRPRVDGVEYGLDHWGDRFAIVTNLTGEDFAVMTADIATPGNWSPFIEHVPGKRISAFDCFAEFAVMQRWEDAQQTLHVVSRDGTSAHIHVSDEPHEVELESNPEYFLRDIRLTTQSLTRPVTVLSWSVTSREFTTLKTTPTRNVVFDDYVSRRIWTVADDGTRLPIDIVHHRDTPLDGTAPCYMYGYGAYEISTPPWFSIIRLSLLDRGWVWALVHPRGGGELGRGWYNGGKLLNKRNTFTDTVACADHLARDMVDGSRMVLVGGSAGGLLVGASVNIAPTRWAAAIAEVPFVDVTTTMSDPTLPLTVTEWEEWGDPRSEPWASYIESYSPYDNLRPQKYPAMYVTAGINDPRVSFHEPSKYVARLREMSPDTTVVYSCEMDSGHGGPSGRYARWRKEARLLTFAIVTTQTN